MQFSAQKLVRGLCPDTTYRFPHIGRKASRAHPAPKAFRHRCSVSKPQRAHPRPARPAPPGMPVPAHKRPRRCAAFLLAPTGRQRPFPADCGPCLCKKGRKLPDLNAAMPDPPPNGRERRQDATLTDQNGHQRCRERRIRGKSTAIAPVPRSCHTGWKWCPAARCGETGEKSSGLFRG